MASHISQVNYLSHNYSTEWHTTFRKNYDELDYGRCQIFCVCGQLATGMHIDRCLKFRKVVEQNTIDDLKHLLVTKL